MRGNDTIIVGQAPGIKDLNDCGCCNGLTAEAPVEITNRPGLTAIAYRIGTHSKFKQSLLAHLSSSGPALASLKTRDDSDYTIALLDAWATVADVLTFYQERIANESYLRTAAERGSILEMARMIGYELSSGVAADAYLAFTLEDTPGAPLQTTIDVGNKVQSIPGPGEKPQTFETVEKIEARAEWNAIRPRMTQPQKLSADMGCVILQGIATNLKPGDSLLIAYIADSTISRVTMRILNITTDEDAKTTRVDFKTPSLSPSNYVRPSLSKGSINDFPTKVPLDEDVIQEIIGKKWSAEDLLALARIQNWPVEDLVRNITKRFAEPFLQANTGVFVFRQRAALFGYNAPKMVTYNTTTKLPNPASGWDEWSLDSEGGSKLFLDAAYDSILPGSYIMIEKPEKSHKILLTSQTMICPRTAYGISSKTTMLTFGESQSWWDSFGKTPSSKLEFLRDITVRAQSEPLTPSEVPIEDPVQDNSVTLDGIYLDLKKGQKIILTGERSDLKGVTVSEVMTLEEVIIEAGFTVLTFDEKLAYIYVRDTVVIKANVARATPGESVQEVLGSGDAGQAYQKFTLRQPPLTYVSAATSSGAESTLEVRVNDLLWKEVFSLYGHGPNEHIYVTRTDDDGTTTVQFGDGVTGARLPSGQDNVRAAYRKGIGQDGSVKADQLSMLMTRPLGLKGVSNPLAATGAEDRESLNDARQNAPVTVLTLDRAVSLKDYEDFSRTFAGIAKALAVETWDGRKRSVFITVAGPEGAEIGSDSPAYKNLISALLNASDPYVNIQLKSYRQALFSIEGKIKVLPEYLQEKVLGEVVQALRTCFSFDARAFGQPVMMSEVIAVMQDVPGVEAVDLDKLYRAESGEESTTALPARLIAEIPAVGSDGDVEAAELLTLDPAPIELGVMT